jgi:outer membrane protein assembly factor BamB
VVSLDKASGAIRWRHPSPLNTAGRAFPQGSLVASNDTTVVAGDYDVLGFSRRTGRLLWQFSPDDGYGPGLYLGATTRDSAFAGSPGGHLHSIDVSNGRRRWSLSVVDSGNATVYQPIVDRDIALAGFTEFDRPLSGGVVAVDARTGVERWRRRFPHEPPGHSGGNNAWAGGPVTWRELVIAASSSGSIYAFDRFSGTLRHRIVRGMADASQDVLPLVVSRDTLIVGSLTGLVVAYELPSFRERWRYSPAETSSVLFGMTAAADSVFVPYAGGRIVKLGLDNGRVRWTIPRHTSSFVWPPGVDDRSVYVVGDTSVTAFRR